MFNPRAASGPPGKRETVFADPRLAHQSMALRFESRAIPPPDVPTLLKQATAAYIGPDAIILHAGAVADVQASDMREVAALRDEARHMTWEHAGPGGPLWLGGLAFHRSGEGPWSGFPAARFALPKLQWACIDGQWTETSCDAPVMAELRPGTGACHVADPQAWSHMVAEALDAIQSGEVTKVVLARCHPAPSSDPAAGLARLLDNADGTGFLFRAGATFFGCTPERLVRLQAGAVTTHALAGSTRRADGDEDVALARALQGSGKDVLEHELVVAFLRERLVEAGVTGVHQASRRLRRLRHVQHLETPIQGTAPTGSHILDLAQALHPSPAVCGTPRQKSLALIRRLEAFPRGWYAGAVGWFDAAGEGELSVALRCALDTGAQRYLFAGAGIVAGSRADDEWAETESKLAAMLEVS